MRPRRGRDDLRSCPTRNPDVEEDRKNFEAFQDLGMDRMQQSLFAHPFLFAVLTRRGNNA